MKNTDLYRGIGEADDKYIKSAGKAFEKGENKEKRQNAGRIIRKVLSVAAAVVIIGGVWAISYTVVLKGNTNTTPGSTETGYVTGVETADNTSENTKEPVLTTATDTEESHDPESECAKMKKAFDMYFEAKEQPGEYNGYDVSFAKRIDYNYVKYIGYISEKDMPFTQDEDLIATCGLPFVYPCGQRLTVLDPNTDTLIYGIDEACDKGILDSAEVEAFFAGYYKQFRSMYDAYMPVILRKGIAEFLGDEDCRYTMGVDLWRERTYRDYLDIRFCMKLSNNRYAVLYQTYFDANPDFSEMVVSTGGLDFKYRDGMLLYILDEYDTITFLGGYESDLPYKIPVKELQALHEKYTEYFNFYYKQTEYETVKAAFEAYFDAGKAGTYYGYYIPYAENINGTYIGFADKEGTAFSEGLRWRTVAGYPFYLTSGQNFTVLKGDDYEKSLYSAYAYHIVSENEVGLFFERYKAYLGDAFDNTHIIQTSMYTYLDGLTERNDKDDTVKPTIPCYNYINVNYCIQLSDNKYAALYRVLGEITPDFDEMPVGLVYGDCIYTFLFKNGLELRIVDGNGIHSLSNDVLTPGEIYELYDSYKKYINGDPVRIREAFESFIQTGEGYYGESRVYYAYKAADSDTYFGIFTPGDLEEWNETVAGYTFEHPNGNKFIVIKHKRIIEGLTEAYNQGEISADAVREFYEAYTGYEQSRADNVNRRSAAKSMTKALEKYLSECKQFLTLDASLSVPLNQSGGLYGSYYVKSCIAITGENGAKYFAFISPHDEDHKNVPWSEEIEGITFDYPTTENLTVIYDRIAYFSLSEAYEAGVVTRQDLNMVKEYLF